MHEHMYILVYVYLYVRILGVCTYNECMYVLLFILLPANEKFSILS
jgi:hypothetical protein